MKTESTVKRVWRIAYPVLLWFGIQYAVQIPYIAVLTVLNLESIYEYGAEYLMEELLMAHVLPMTLVCNVISIAVLSVFYFKDKKNYTGNPLDRKGGADAFTVALTVLVGIGACLAGNMITNLLVAVAVKFFGEGVLSGFQQVSDSIASSGIVMQVITVVIVSPILEELLVRGLLYKRMRGYLSVFGAMAISSAIFGIVHGNWVQFVYATALGMLLAYVYEISGNLLIPIIFHMVANGVATFMEYAPVSRAYEYLYETFFFPLLILTSAITVCGILAIRFYQKAKRS